MCHYAQTMEQISEILLLKFVLNFLNFTFACSLCSSTSGAVLSQQASLVYQLDSVLYDLLNAANYRFITWKQT